MLGVFDRVVSSPAEQYQLLAPDMITCQTPYGEPLPPTRIFSDAGLLGRPKIDSARLVQARMAQRHVTSTSKDSRQSPKQPDVVW
jgi:hypothetical protein